MRRLTCMTIPVLMAVSLCWVQSSWAQRNDLPAPRADADIEGDVRADSDRGDGGRARVRADADDRPDDRDRADDRRDRRDDRRDDRDRGQSSNRSADSRYRFHQGRWWYLTSSGNWLYWQNNRWNQFQGGGGTYSQASAGPRYYNSGYAQPYYNNGYYGSRYYNNGYYGNGYYNNGYYNNGYYGTGYRGMPYGYNGPGMGNRGWGNMNYGSRRANRGSNIGGLIDQGTGGSGQAGAFIGGAISR
jgi:hypothetical protein